MQDSSAGLLDVSDATLFDAPGAQAWRVLVGVVDGLAQQLDPQRFEDAVDALAAYAERIPEELRVCPNAWLNILFDEVPDPRLRLVRSLNISWSTFGWSGKAMASWVEALADAPHVRTLRVINLYTMQPGKAHVKALTRLFTVAEPTRWRLLNSKSKLERELLEAFDAAGVRAQRVDHYLDDGQPPERSDSAALDDQEARLRVKDAETFRALLARDDLDHVASLCLTIDYDWDSSAVGGLDGVAAPAWRRLRQLTVHVHERHEALAAHLGRWLKRARPVAVLADGQAVCAQLLAKGVYRRAFGSELYVYDTRDLIGPLAKGEVQVMALLRDPNSAYAGDDSSLSLLAAMPERARSALRSLDWKLDRPEFERVEELAAALPALTVWCAFHPAVTDDREALVQALAAAPSARRLRLFIPHEPYQSARGKTPPLASKHAKLLDKGQGLRSEAYVVYNHSSYPYGVTW